MKKRTSFRSRFCAALLFFFAAVFALPAVSSGDVRLYILAGAVPGCIILLLLLPSGIFPLDRPSIAAALTLCALGILAPAALDADEAVTHAMRCAAALAFLVLGAVLVRSFRFSLPTAAVTSLFALGTLAFPLFLSSVSLSMSSGGTALLMFSVSAFLSRRLRLPALAVALGGVFLLLLMKDFSGAAVWCFTAVLLFWVVSGSGLWSSISLVSVAALAVGFFLLSPQAALPHTESPLPVLGNLSVFSPQSPPQAAVVPGSSLFFLLGQQYGLIILLCAPLLLIALLLRAASLALNTRDFFHASLAVGAVLLFGSRSLWFLLCASGLLPLQADSFPLLTDDIPQLFADFFLLGLLCGVSARNAADLEEDTRLSMLAH